VSSAHSYSALAIHDGQEF